ncbi:MAG: DUF2267 domain-containing protein [Chloroflexota bacterium]
MDELVKMVSEKTGLPEAQAQQAAEAVLEFLKDKLPGPVAGQIDNVLEGGGASSMLKKGLGGLLG